MMTSDLVVFRGSMSDFFNIHSGVKQGCVLDPTLFWTFFVVLQKQALRYYSEVFYLTGLKRGPLTSPGIEQRLSNI